MEVHKLFTLTMTNSPPSRTPSLYSLFGITIGLTLLIWLLRGLGVLTFIPGAVIWVLLFLSIGIGIISTLQRG